MDTKVATRPEPPRVEFDDVMLHMDVVDTIRHESLLAEEEMSAPERREAMIGKLRTIYAGQGVAVSDEILARGVDTVEQRRFHYEPTPDGLRRSLATAYVRRGRMGLYAGVGFMGLAAMAGGLSYASHRQEQARQAQVERLTVDLPAQLRRAVAAIRSSFPNDRTAATLLSSAEAEGNAALARGDEAAALAVLTRLDAILEGARTRALDAGLREDAERLAASGLAVATSADAREAMEAAGVALRQAAASGDRSRYESARENLETLRNQIETPLRVRIVDRAGERSGVWRTRDGGATKVYYLVVEAERPDGTAVPRRVRNAETGTLQGARTFAIRVDQATYDRVAADKRTDGIVDDREVGSKPAGHLDIDWSIPTDGATITEWN